MKMKILGLHLPARFDQSDFGPLPESSLDRMPPAAPEPIPQTSYDGVAITNPYAGFGMLFSSSSD